jgi:ketosteroid isomerase-like protein
MASDQVELVREALDAYRADGIEALLEYTAPDIEWHTGGTFVDEGTCRGHDAVRRYLGAMEDAFEGLRVDPLELIDAGDAVVGHTRDTARGRGSGVPVEVDHYYAICSEATRSGASRTSEIGPRHSKRSVWRGRAASRRSDDSRRRRAPRQSLTPGGPRRPGY